jgi:transcription elongation GreA/GreB family factor
MKNISSWKNISYTDSSRNTTSFTKRDLLNRYLDILNSRKVTNDNNIALANKDAIEWEWTMQSRYDTKKEEWQAMEDAYRIRWEEILKKIQEVKKLFYIIENNNWKISKSKISSIIKILDINKNQEKKYFLVPWWWLEQIWDILYLWVETPLWKQLIWKEAGEEYEIKLPNGILEIEVLDIS